MTQRGSIFLQKYMLFLLFNLLFCLGYTKKPFRRCEEFFHKRQENVDKNTVCRRKDNGAFADDAKAKPCNKADKQGCTNVTEIHNQFYRAKLHISSSRNKGAEGVRRIVCKTRCLCAAEAYADKHHANGINRKSFSVALGIKCKERAKIVFEKV